MSESTAMKGTLKEIKISDIRENPVALRDVNRTSEKYLELVDSVRNKGVLNPILVRELTDPDTGGTIYGLIDGLHRFSAAQDAGLSTIGAHIQQMGDADTMEAQLVANVHKVETRPVEYTNQLINILSRNPLMTIAQLAAKINKSPTWLSERLKLTKLAKPIQELVDDDKVNLSNAFALAKLPPEEQIAFLDRAQTMTPQEFVPTVNARVKEIRDAKRAGKEAAPAEFVAVPHIRKLGEMKEELANRQIGPALIKDLKIKNPDEAFNLGVAWCLMMDPPTVSAAREKDRVRKEKDRADKIARDTEKAQKRQADAEAKQKKAREDLERLNQMKAPQPAGAAS